MNHPRQPAPKSLRSERPLPGKTRAAWVGVFALQIGALAAVVAPERAT